MENRKKNKWKINVIGLGYIGLPTALMLSGGEFEIVGTDLDSHVVKKLSSGKATFSENGMDELFTEAYGRDIRFSTEYEAADIYIVAVPTPYRKATKKVDASYVINAVDRILKICPEYCTIVIESTVSPGTIDAYVRPLISGEKDVQLAHAPERIIPGRIIFELQNNSRIIGADNEETGEKIKTIYQSFCKGTIITTDIRTAEMTKVVENTYRDINIAFANELTKICRTAKLDVYEIIRIANMHPRVNILSPGPGVGGHCISVDPWFLVGDYPGLANIILAARKINDSMPEYVLERTSEIMEERGIQDVSKVGFYGLTYKEDVDDIRESPTLQLLSMMKKHLAMGAKVYDPYITEKIAANQFFDFMEFVRAVDLIVIMVGHKQIKEHQDAIKDKVIFDTRNVVELKGVYHL
ncbi:MAG: nucleotide sugar dehydrogenase [Lachnospiraceae bacterium]|nr:nucleotide sugar dehydrogenase [Lachnospiraceae bacterium]